MSWNIHSPGEQVGHCRSPTCPEVVFSAPLPLKQRFLIFRKQLIIYGEQIHSVRNPIKNDGVPPVPGIKLGKAALLQKLLGFLQCGGQAKAQANQAVPGRYAAARKNLMQIYFAHAGQLGKRRFGNPPFLKKPAQ